MHAAKGSRGVDALFQDPPESELALVDPSSALRHPSTVDVGTPKLGPGESPVGKPDDLGAFGLFLVLASRLPAADAVAAADLWRGDRLVQFERDGHPCVRVDVAGADTASTAKIGRALDRWAAASGGTGAAGDLGRGPGERRRRRAHVVRAGRRDRPRSRPTRCSTPPGSSRNATRSPPSSRRCSAAEVGRSASRRSSSRNSEFQRVVEQIDDGAVTADDGQAELARVVAGIRDQVLAACG